MTATAVMEIDAMETVMSEQSTLLAQTVDGLFAELAATADDASVEWQSAAWLRLEELGIPGLFLSEEKGGFGGSWCDAYVVLHRLGLHALPLPLAATLLAQRWLTRIDVTVPQGMIALGHCADAQLALESGTRTPPRFSGSVPAVPWGAQAQWLLAACEHNGRGYFALLPTDAAVPIATTANLAGEPRALLRFLDAPTTALFAHDDAAVELATARALLHAAQMAGALQATLQLAVGYASERTQFGRAIGKFQAIQQQLAVLAEECAAAGCAALSACAALDSAPAVFGRGIFDNCAFEIGAAKLRANRAAAQATAIAHQVHGAIGFTREHRLHRFTLRLLAWRGEFGNDRHWAARLGALLSRPGSGTLWQQLTARDERSTQPHLATTATAEETETEKGCCA